MYLILISIIYDVYCTAITKAASSLLSVQTLIRFANKHVKDQDSFPHAQKLMGHDSYPQGCCWHSEDASSGYTAILNLTGHLLLA